MPSWLAITLGVLLAFGLCVLAYASLIERHAYRVRTEHLKVLPVGNKPIRVLHISDLHLRRGQRRKLKWISRLDALKPDLVVNTGDNLGGPGAIETLALALQPLSGVAGVFVNGSNDYSAPRFRNPFAYLRGPSQPSVDKPLDTEALEQALESLGWLNLNNQSAQILVSGQELSVLGIDDPHIGRANFDELCLGPKIQNGLRIGVAHAPYLAVLESFATLDTSVVFAGHTHGGQVCLPGGRALITNCDLPPEYARGLSAWSFGDKTLVLHVCAGLGTSILAPFRLFSPPEVALIELLPTS